MTDEARMKNDIEEAILFAKKYLEDLLSFFGLNTDVYATTEDHEVIELNVPSTHLNGFLIGQRGETLRALQYLISTVLKNQSFAYSRVNVDVADYKKNRAQRLLARAEEWFREVRDSDSPKELEPMNAAERRVIHQAATDYGLQTESIGEGRDRHVVLKPGGEDASPEQPPDSEE
jgi:spoIIIJ-associated protein